MRGVFVFRLKPTRTIQQSTMATEESAVAGPTLPEAKMHLAPVHTPVIGTVVSNERCTASNKAAGFVHHVAIDVSGTALAGNFLSGQSFGVIAPGTDAKGLSHKVRLYSIASPTFGEDGEGRVLATTVKRLIDEHHETGKLFLGVASNYLCDLKPGDKVTLSGPNGKRFLLPADIDAHDYVFFATGTGVAPFRGMILELLQRKTTSRIVLVMGSTYASDLLYHKELEALSSSNANFTYLPTLSRERQSDGNAAMYVQDRLKTNAATLIPVLATSRGLVYVCGIAGMELGILRNLATSLDPQARAQYLAVDAAAMADPSSWDRKMIHKQVRPTRRVFLEVY
jgi:ferredoxin--NADP+ reductase